LRQRKQKLEKLKYKKENEKRLREKYSNQEETQERPKKHEMKSDDFADLKLTNPTNDLGECLSAMMRTIREIEQRI
jgi:hypothetical protein